MCLEGQQKRCKDMTFFHRFAPSPPSLLNRLGLFCSINSSNFHCSGSEVTYFTVTETLQFLCELIFIINTLVRLMRKSNPDLCINHI